MRGWVYIAKNESLVDMVKIGYTDSDPLARMESLSNTSIPTPFKVIYEALVDSPYEFEQLLHKHFDDDRVSQDREFFRTTPQEIVNRLRVVADEMELTIYLENSYFQDIDHTVRCTITYLKLQREIFRDNIRQDINSFKSWVRKKNLANQDKIIEIWNDREVSLGKYISNIINDDFLLNQLLLLNKKFLSTETLNKSVQKTFWNRFFLASSWIADLTRNRDGNFEQKRFMCRKCRYSGQSNDFQIRKNSIEQYYFVCGQCTHWNSWILK
jgi:hypothetical protein